MNLLKYLKNKSRGDPGKSLQFGVYNNIGHNKDDIIRDMSSWAFKLESQGRISQTWCIKDMAIDVVGDVDVRGIDLIFPFGVVTGEFICEERLDIFGKTQEELWDFLMENYWKANNAKYNFEIDNLNFK